MLKEPRSLRILVVDDEALIRWSLAETLSECGHEVVEAGDAESAVTAVTGAMAPFDVALLDFRLPDSADLALMSRLRRMSPSTQIIFMTAYATPEILKGALNLGAFCVISKPFEISQISALVKQANTPRV